MLILIVDQVTKAIVRSQMQVNESIGLLPGVLRLTFVRNAGAAFGLFPGRQPVFVITSLFVLFAIAAYWRHARPRQWPVVIALAMIASGALGNLIDRAVIGHVTDFFEFAFIDFPVFNVADMGIVCGVVLLMAWILFGPEPGAQGAEGDVSGDNAGEHQLAHDAEEAGADEAPAPVGSEPQAAPSDPQDAPAHSEEPRP